MVHTVKKHAYGTGAEVDAYAVPAREIVINVDDYSMVVGDDVALGGHSVFRGEPSGATPYSIPTSGATITCALGERHRIIAPAGTIAALTITLPGSPRDGDPWEGLFNQAITALTVNAPGGAGVYGSGILIPAKSGASWLYNASDAHWYRRY